MNGNVKRVAPLLLCSLIVAVPSPRAAWVQDGVPLCTAAWDQWIQQAIADDNGGTIVVWQDERSGDSDIYVQRVNASGAVQWTANGLVLCAATNVQVDPQVASDGAGGAIVVWEDYRGGTPDIYAQRVSAAGAVQWTANGVVVCAAALSQSNPQIVADGAGGAIVAWNDYRGGANYDIYAQRVNAAGAGQWTANGVALCTSAGNQGAPQLASDDAEGAIVAWEDPRSGNNDIYAQRMSSAGVTQWTAQGVALCVVANSQTNPVLVADGAGGAIVAWEDLRGGATYDIYAQGVSAAGGVQWTAGGVVIGGAGGDQRTPRIAADGAGGAVVTWEDYRSGTHYDIYAQLVSAAGAVEWTPNGAALCVVAGNQRRPQIASDAAGGAIVTWEDYRSGTHYDIYAQRVGGAGAVQWRPNGVALCTAAGDQSVARIAADGAGGALVAWNEEHIGTGNDIYAQKIAGNGRLVSSLQPILVEVGDVPNDQGGKVGVRWLGSASDKLPEQLIAYYSLWRSIDFPAAQALVKGGARVVEAVEVGADFYGRGVRRTTLGSAEYWWEWMGNTSAHGLDHYSMTCATLSDSLGTDLGMHYFFVSAHTQAPFEFWDSDPDSGYSVDNLAPCLPASLAGKRSFTPVGLALSWDRNPDVDLGHYAVYRGMTAGFVPGPGNRIASPCDTLCFDGDWRWDSGYYYKASAIDLHGNESGFALLRPTDVTGVDTQRAPAASYLAQNCPNPFNPRTRIAFGLEGPAHVALGIYAATGTLVRSLVDGHREAGHYEAVWDGTDDRGRAVSSGIYFCRFTTNAFESTRKMILVQ